MKYHEYDGVKIPVMEGKSARSFYNLPDEEIDKQRCDTWFNEGGDCMEPGGFRGTAFEDAFEYLSDDECRELVEIQKKNRSGLFHLFRDHKVPVKNQGPNGYCWGYGACTAYEAALLVRDRDYTELSPDSVCAPVKRGRDQGGWASEFLEYADDHGIAPQTMWKKHDRNYRKYDTPEVNEARKEFIPDEWVNLKRGDMQAVRTLLATNNGCGLGLMWWYHFRMPNG